MTRGDRYNELRERMMKAGITVDHPTLAELERMVAEADE